MNNNNPYIKKLTASILVAFYLLITLIPANVASANELPEGQTPSGIPFSEMEAEIEAVINDYLGVTTPGVAVVVTYGGEIIFSRGYGYANLESQIPIDPATTVFGYGSIGKLFTWTAVMQLVEQGRIDLDGDISDYLPEDFLAELDFNYTFTMRHLMNHTAGFAENIIGFAFDMEETEEQISLREGLLIAQPPQIFEPGTVSSYSNFGVGLAGYIVGYVTGEDFVTYEMENILLPVGLTNTLNGPDWFDNDDFLQHRATGYVSDGDDGFSVVAPLYIAMYPAGALSGTAEDLARFVLALTPELGESGPLFETPAGLNAIFTSSVTDPTRLSRYHGFLSYETANDPAFGHGGTLPDFNTNLAFVPETGFGVVALANSGEATVELSVVNLLLGSQEDVQPGSGTLPDVAQFEGQFINARHSYGRFTSLLDYLGQTTVTQLDENIIQMSMLGGFAEATFVQVEPYVFHLMETTHPIVNTFTGGEIQFITEDGQVTQIEFSNPFNLIPVPRTATSITMSMTVVGISALFFLIAPLVSLVVFLRNKKKGIASNRFQKLNRVLLLCGTALTINNLVMLIRLLVINPFRTAAEMNPHIFLNYALAGAAAIVLVFSLLTLRHKEGKATTKQSIFFAITALLVLSLLFVLQSWHFFVIL